MGRLSGSEGAELRHLVDGTVLDATLGRADGLEALVEEVNAELADVRELDELVTDALGEIRREGLHVERTGPEAERERLEQVQTELMCAYYMDCARAEAAATHAGMIASRQAVIDHLLDDPAGGVKVPPELAELAREVALEWAGAATRAQAALPESLFGAVAARARGRALDEAVAYHGFDFVRAAYLEITRTEEFERWERGLCEDRGMPWSREAGLGRAFERSMRPIRRQIMLMDDPARLAQPEGEWELMVPFDMARQELPAFPTPRTPSFTLPDGSVEGWRWVGTRATPGQEGRVELVSPSGVSVFGCRPSRMTDSQCPWPREVEVVAAGLARGGWMEEAGDMDPDRLLESLAGRARARFELTEPVRARGLDLSAPEPARPSGREAAGPRPARDGR